MSNNIILFHLFLCQTFVGGVQINFTEIRFKQDFDLHLFLMLVALFPVSYLMQIFLTRSTTYIAASSMMPFGYFGIMFSLVVDTVVYDADFDWISIAGIFLTSSGLLSKLFLK